MRTVAAAAVAVVLVAGAAVGLVRAASGGAPPTVAQQTEQVAAGLRCPTCAGESVAASRADAADSMRAVIADQLRAGRTPAQVRAWFAQRYGDWVLLDPPSRGPGLPLHLLPLAALGIGAIALVGATRRRPPQAGVVRRRRVPLVAAAVTACAAIAVAVVATSGAAQPQLSSAAAAAPADGVQRGRQLEAQGRLEDAATAYRAALRDDPADEQVALRLGFLLLRTQHAAEAVDVLTPVVARNGRSTQALLVLGLAQRAAGDPAASATLQRFLALAPDDPAAGKVRSLLGSR